MLPKSAWAIIKPATLHNLVAGMPKYVAKRLAMNGKHIGRY